MEGARTLERTTVTRVRGIFPREQLRGNVGFTQSDQPLTGIHEYNLVATCPEDEEQGCAISGGSSATWWGLLGLAVGVLLLRRRS